MTKGTTYIGALTNELTQKSKRFVKTHVPHFVAVASVATTVGVVYYYHNKIFIEVTPAMVEQLKFGGRWVFPVHDEDVLITLSPV